MTKRRDVGEKKSIWLDSRNRFGLLSRALHWGMAYLLIWQFGMILAWRMFPDAELLKTVARFGPYYGTVGILTAVLVVLRALWAFANRNRRPGYAGGMAGFGARVGHAGLYLLMFATPAVALLRTFGRGDGWQLWSIPIVPSTGQRIDWLISLGNSTHRVLAWALCLLIVGHVVMALLHGLLFRDGVFGRMAGFLHRKAGSPENCRQIAEKENIACREKSRHPSA